MSGFCENERFQKILDDIKKSTKIVKILPSDESVRKKLSEEYSINPESLLGLLLENTGGIYIRWSFCVSG